MKKHYTIGEMAKIMNISVKALRNYERIDLLNPSYQDPITNYRYYTYNQCFTIDIIRYMNKILNIPLEDIKQLLQASGDSTELRKILASQRLYLRQQIAKYEYSIQLIDNMVADMVYRDTMISYEKQYELYMMPRNFYYLEINAPLEEIDKYVNRSLSQLIHTKNIDNDTICLMFSKSDFEKTGKLMLKGFGLFSEQRLNGLQMKKFEEGRYLVQRFKYSEENCVCALEELLDSAKQQNFSLDDYGLLVSKAVDLTAKNKYDYDMELQIFRFMK